MALRCGDVEDDESEGERKVDERREMGVVTLFMMCL